MSLSDIMRCFIALLIDNSCLIRIAYLQQMKANRTHPNLNENHVDRDHHRPVRSSSDPHPS